MDQRSLDVVSGANSQLGEWYDASDLLFNFLILHVSKADIVPLGAHSHFAPFFLFFRFQNPKFHIPTALFSRI
jgi:hypothetical protein